MGGAFMTGAFEAGALADSGGASAKTEEKGLLASAPGAGAPGNAAWSSEENWSKGLAIFSN